MSRVKKSLPQLFLSLHTKQPSLLYRHEATYVPYRRQAVSRTSRGFLRRRYVVDFPECTGLGSEIIYYAAVGDGVKVLVVFPLPHGVVVNRGVIARVRITIDGDIREDHRPR